MRISPQYLALADLNYISAETITHFSAYMIGEFIPLHLSNKKCPSAGHHFIAEPPGGPLRINVWFW
ncbi:hypothetical protein M408DRAFT_110557 [Serendipita vermifera MAFF 305830]|uniref:Uncharacterized protein n=1 Tax=Serendipita vermifera MAFF 305830 TaxID=933852 RepID=A0A0C3AMF5_SERVB|nr:hypothetical protein M408DRAFT_110557 [Serendipita vermifera MAFF 305830]